MSQFIKHSGADLTHKSFREEGNLLTCNTVNNTKGPFIYDGFSEHGRTYNDIFFSKSLYIKDNKITPCTSHYTHVGIIFKNLTEGNNLIDFKSKFVKKFLDDEYNNPAYVPLGSDGNLIWKLFHLLIKDMTIIRKEYDRLNNVVSLPKNIVVSLILIGLGVRKISII